MVNQDQWNQKAFDYIHEQREKALRCTICKRRLFTFDECLDEFIKKNYRYLMNYQDIIKGIFLFIYENYNLRMEDGHMIRHHTNYKKGITIPVCDVCHRKIHQSKNNQKYTQYLPVDERPKNTKEIVYTLYDADKLIEKS